MICLFQNRYQVTTAFETDRTFLEDETLARITSTLEMGLVQGFGEFGDIEDAVMTSHLSHLYVYGKNANQSEFSSRVRHPF